MTLQDLLNKVCDGGSDGSGSRKLSITAGMFSAYRNARKIPSNDVVEKIIDVTGINPVTAYLAVYAERIENKEVSRAFRENLH